MFPHLTY